MSDRLKSIFDSLTDHYVAVCLFLSLFILTWVGVGDAAITGLLGLLLCIVGSVQHPGKADLRIFTPLVLYDLISLASSCLICRNIVDGYASTQMIYPVIYLLMACTDKQELSLSRRLYVLWTEIVALCGILQYVYAAAFQGRGGRLSGFPGNPNALGIFLVIGWLSLQDREPEQKKELLDDLQTYLEPFLLTALAITLSMGSFLSMAAGILVLFISGKKNLNRQESLRYLCWLLAKAGFGIGIGVLFYLAASRTDVPKICLLLFLYLLAVSAYWKRFCSFLKKYPRISFGISAAGAIVACVVILIRPSALATFSERLEMMQSGISYLTANPLLGVGPYQWRFLDLRDGGTYFNTWHIHNALLHVGVEIGLIAMAMLVVIIIRFFRKKKSPSQKAAFLAFLFHNLMDTSFFYLSITTFSLVMAGDPDDGGKQLSGVAVRILFGIFALFFAGILFFSMAS